MKTNFFLIALAVSGVASHFLNDFNIDDGQVRLKRGTIDTVDNCEHSAVFFENITLPEPIFDDETTFKRFHHNMYRLKQKILSKFDKYCGNDKLVEQVQYLGIYVIPKCDTSNWKRRVDLKLALVGLHSKRLNSSTIENEQNRYVQTATENNNSELEQTMFLPERTEKVVSTKTVTSGSTWEFSGEISVQFKIGFDVLVAKIESTYAAKAGMKYVTTGSRTETTTNDTTITFKSQQRKIPPHSKASFQSFVSVAVTKDEYLLDLELDREKSYAKISVSDDNYCLAKCCVNFMEDDASRLFEELSQENSNDKDEVSIQVVGEKFILTNVPVEIQNIGYHLGNDFKTEPL